MQLAELRNSWSAWLGVAVGFLATGFTMALSVLVVSSGQAAVATGRIATENSGGLVLGPQINLVFCALIGLSVIGAATSLVIDSRRGSVARLALAGATPGQVAATVIGQLAVVSVTCAVLADALAAAALRPTLRFLTVSRDEGLVIPDPVYAPGPVLATNLLTVAVALLGGWRQARRAGRIAPVEALREAAVVPAEAMSVGRWIRAALCVLALGGLFATIPAVTAHRTSETISTLLQASLGVLVLTAVLVAVLAPLVVGPLTRAWTRLVPTDDPRWTLARGTTIARGARLTKSVVPVAMSIGLLFGLLAFFDTLTSSAAAAGLVISLDQAGPAAMVTMLGAPLLVAVSGGIGSLIMMARQRDAELALAGIVGVTPAQRVAIPVLEGLIITGTGLLLGLVMTGSSLLYLAVALPRVPFPFAFAPSWGVFGISAAIMAVIITGTTVLPTLPALRRPEPAVIGRLVAE